MKQHIPEQTNEQVVADNDLGSDHGSSSEGRSMHEIMNQLQAQKFYRGQLVNEEFHRSFPEKVARIGKKKRHKEDYFLLVLN